MPKLKEVGAFENNVGRNGGAGAHVGEGFADYFFGFAADEGAFVEHAVNFVAQRLPGPAFSVGHSQVKLALHAVRQGKHLDKMRPTQLCRQWRHNLDVGKILGELHHAAEVAGVEAAAAKVVF